MIISDQDERKVELAFLKPMVAVFQSPQHVKTAEQMTLALRQYKEALARFSPEVLQDAWGRLRDRHRFSRWPTVAECVEACRGVTNDAVVEPVRKEPQGIEPQGVRFGTVDPATNRVYWKGQYFPMNPEEIALCNNAVASCSEWLQDKGDGAEEGDIKQQRGLQSMGQTMLAEHEKHKHRQVNWSAVPKPEQPSKWPYRRGAAA